jgi:transcriptional regulator with PAS, ATPase and Fis domain
MTPVNAKTPESAAGAPDFDELPEIIGRSPALRVALASIRRLGVRRRPMLIEGESGTGKELVARAVHRLAGARGPFVAVNCAAIPDSLIEAEFFGHQRGAFTGADRDRRGLFEEAADGTLFLDEIGEAAPRLQAALLRVLEERKVRRVGANRDEPIAFTVVAATNRPLLRMVAERRFREDLFYRLNVHFVHLPPLRERREDIPLIAAHFLEKVSVENAEPAKRLSEPALRALMDLPWPGNVRELQNVLARTAALTPGGVIERVDLRLGLEQVKTEDPSHLLTLPFAQAKEAWTRWYLRNLLARNGGNVSKAAAAAGMYRQSLQRLLRETELSTPDPGTPRAES